jgi:hypothetical protein
LTLQNPPQAATLSPAPKNISGWRRRWLNQSGSEVRERRL